MTVTSIPKKLNIFASLLRKKERKAPRMTQDEKRLIEARKALAHLPLKTQADIGLLNDVLRRN